MVYPQPYGASPYMQPQKRRLDFVAGEEGMRSFYVGPGEVVALFDTGSATMWLKSANETGVPNCIRYELVERPDEPEKTDATASRLDAMEASISEMREALSAAISDFRAGTAKPGDSGRQAGSANGRRKSAGGVRLDAPK